MVGQLKIYDLGLISYHMVFPPEETGELETVIAGI